MYIIHVHVNVYVYMYIYMYLYMYIMLLHVPVHKYTLNVFIASAVCFLEFWKRYQNVLQYEWDVAHFELEEVR